MPSRNRPLNFSFAFGSLCIYVLLLSVSTSSLTLSMFCNHLHCSLSATKQNLHLILWKYLKQQCCMRCSVNSSSCKNILNKCLQMWRILSYFSHYTAYFQMIYCFQLAQSIFGSFFHIFQIAIFYSQFFSLLFCKIQL